MKKEVQKHNPALERIRYGKDGEITEYDYLGTPAIKGGEEMEDMNVAHSSFAREDWIEATPRYISDGGELGDSSGALGDALIIRILGAGATRISDSAKEFIQEVLRLDRRHLFDIIALANRAAGELHDTGIA